MQIGGGWVLLFSKVKRMEFTGKVTFGYGFEGDEGYGMSGEQEDCEKSQCPGRKAGRHLVCFCLLDFIN